MLSKEALKLVLEKAPAIVDEHIIAHAFDEVAEFTGDLMGRLTQIDAEDPKLIALAHQIIRVGLLREMTKQINKELVGLVDNNIRTLFKK
jgi:hypothetical protein